MVDERANAAESTMRVKRAMPSESTRPRERSLYHFLLTIELAGCHLHGYLMAPHKAYAASAIDKMMTVAEETWPGFLPVILQTELSDGVELVREIVSRNSAKAGQLIAEATDFHFSVFVMPKGTHDDTTLMQLH
jgi:hypothetical protein